MEVNKYEHALVDLSNYLEQILEEGILTKADIHREVENVFEEEDSFQKGML